MEKEPKILEVGNKSPEPEKEKPLVEENTKLSNYIKETTRILDKGKITIENLNFENCRYIHYLILYLKKQGLSIKELEEGGAEGQKIASLFKEGYKMFAQEALNQLREDKEKGSKKYDDYPISGTNLITEMIEETGYNLSDIGTDEDELKGFLEK